MIADENPKNSTENNSGMGGGSTNNNFPTLPVQQHHEGRDEVDQTPLPQPCSTSKPDDDTVSTPVERASFFVGGDGGGGGHGHSHDHGLNTIVGIMHTLFDVFLVSLNFFPMLIT